MGLNQVAGKKNIGQKLTDESLKLQIVGKVDVSI